jgi:hypothetical protein
MMRFLAVFCSILFSFSCMSFSITDLEIASIDFEFVDSSYRPVNQIIAGQVYEIKALVTASNGDIIDNPDYSDFLIRTDDFTLYDHSSWTLKLHAKNLSFERLQDPEYTFFVSVRNNSYSAQIFKFSMMDPSVYTHNVGFNVSGYSGSSGSSGSSGEDGTEYNLDGTDGQDGEHGGNGQHGSHVSMLAFFYDIADYGFSNDQALVVINTASGDYRISLNDQTSFLIDVSGGYGGDGGDGGDAGNKFSDEGRNGRPGRGGSGGDGGDGGYIHIRYANALILNQIEFDVSGGLGGDAGEGGNTQSLIETIFFNDEISSGTAGSPGRDGRDGNIVLNGIEFELLKEMVGRLQIPNLELERILH